MTVEVANCGYSPTLEEVQVEKSRQIWERALIEGGEVTPLMNIPMGGIAGREVILLVGPAVDVSVEVWEVIRTWNIERRNDGTVIAVHPHRDYFSLEDYRSALEMELPAVTQAVTTAHQARVTEYGGRIGEDTSLPMLVTDANRLRDYYNAVGAYSHPDGPPAQPPPPCGLAMPDQTNNPGLMSDCQALLAARDKLRGTARLNWNVDTTITGWDGVTVGGTPSRVTVLDLESEGLTGSVPPELGRLSNLTEIRLSGNSLTGCLPDGWREIPTNDLSSLGLPFCGS